MDAQSTAQRFDYSISKRFEFSASHQLKKRASHLLKILLRVLVLRFPLIWLRRNVRPNARPKIREVGTLRRLGLGKGSKGKSEGNQYGAAGCIFVESWTVHCFLLSLLSLRASRSFLMSGIGISARVFHGAVVECQLIQPIKRISSQLVV